MPELRSNFRPAWWLPGPHLPTIWGKLGRSRSTVHDRLERIATPDGDHLTLVRMGAVHAGVPHLLILHGLEANVGAKYAHGLLQEARNRGWSGDMLMFRSCDGEVNTARRFYHSGETTDLDFVVRRLIRECPELHLVICGVSLGGNVLLKWLGELGLERTRSTPARGDRQRAVRPRGGGAIDGARVRTRLRASLPQHPRLEDGQKARAVPGSLRPRASSAPPGRSSSSTTCSRLRCTGSVAPTTTTGNRARSDFSTRFAFRPC